MLKLYEEAAELLQGRRLERLRVTLTAVEHARLQKLAAANGWDDLGALRIVLANGVALVEAHAPAGKLTDGTTGHAADSPATPLAETLEHAALAAGMHYAAAKFLVFRLADNNQTLIHNRTGFLSGSDLAAQATAFLLRKRAALEAQSAARWHGRAPAGDGPDRPSATPPSLEVDRALAIEQQVALTPPPIERLPDGSVRYDLAVLDTFMAAVPATGGHGAAPDSLTHRLLELGLGLVEAEGADPGGELPATVLEQLSRSILPAGHRAGDGGPPDDETLKALRHYLEARSKTVVMETRLAELYATGLRLEQEVDTLRAARECWGDWAAAMRAYLARLERAQAEPAARPAPPSQAEALPGSIWSSIRHWLLGVGESPSEPVDGDGPGQAGGAV